MSSHRLLGLFLLSIPIDAVAQPRVFEEIAVREALADDQWRRVDESIDRGLRFIATQQRPNGSFPSSLGGQPAVTSLGVMAYLSRGHQPGEGPYGAVLTKAIDYVVGCQEESGLIVADHNRYPGWASRRRPHTATYNHAISGLMLGEVYGHGDAELNKRLRPVISKAIRWARQMQLRPPRYPIDAGGWRYLHEYDSRKPFSDLSVTGWFVMFYRSARNAEFEVPSEHVDEAADYVETCYQPRTGEFYYGSHPIDRVRSRGMTGAGLLVLTVSGRRDQTVARRAGDWILDHPFDRYGVQTGRYDRFHYGAYYCSQAMYLLGGDYWARFYPVLAGTLVRSQRPDGGWPPEGQNDLEFGRSYSTAMAILALTPPYQMLPIYQR